MRRHTIEGQRMLDSVGGALTRAGEIVRASHEDYDGTGYPDGLAGDAIPIEARICSVCDAFSAMTTDRAYRAAMSEREALEELRRCAGTQFDPRVVVALETLLQTSRSGQHDQAPRSPPSNQCLTRCPPLRTPAVSPISVSGAAHAAADRACAHSGSTGR